jgi:hypothetical protein
LKTTWQNDMGVSELLGADWPCAKEDTWSMMDSSRRAP